MGNSLADQQVLDQKALERLIKEVLAEKLQGLAGGDDDCAQRDLSGVTAISLPKVHVDESNRLDTGVATDRVYTKDVLTVAESPRLGCGMMEMQDTTFQWHLDYDEIDYIIEGALSIMVDGRATTARAGECLYIPKGSTIKFAVEGFARFLYVTYPADWQNT